ncbi:MAG: hypothetical protein WEE64_11720 [Dehalococcoidia bacterium]
MASAVHMATIEDDRRHLPGSDRRPLWNESFWFAFYDPQVEIGVTVRIGNYPNSDHANIYLHLVRQGEIVHSLIDQHAPLPPMEDRRLALGAMEIVWEEPLAGFRLRYAHGAHKMDVTWQGMSPTYLYPNHAPQPEAEALRPAGHIEHAGVVTGTMTLGGATYPLDCFGHRDHTWGDERDWSRLPRWDYLSGEFGRDFWFNAVRVTLGETKIFIGGLWDGHEVMDLAEVRMDVRATDGGTRQTGVELHLVDERQREHHIIGEEVLAIAPTRFGQTWCKDGFARYRSGDRVGYGIIELGYIERA